MIRQTVLILSTALFSGVLFVNIYTSLVDAPNWGSDIPASIETARAYYKTANPGTFFRLFSPINQVLALLALILCWKVDKRMRIYCGLVLMIAILSDVLTFAYFYPRNEVMFVSPVTSNMDNIKTAWSEWSMMNWVRSFIVLIGVYCGFSALVHLVKKTK